MGIPRQVIGQALSRADEGTLPVVGVDQSPPQLLQVKKENKELTGHKQVMKDLSYFEKLVDFIEIVNFKT